MAFCVSSWYFSGVTKPLHYRGSILHLGASMVRFLLFAGITMILGVAQAAPFYLGWSETILSLPVIVGDAEGHFQNGGVNV